MSLRTLECECNFGQISIISSLGIFDIIIVQIVCLGNDSLDATLYALTLFYGSEIVGNCHLIAVAVHRNSGSLRRDTNRRTIVHCHHLFHPLSVDHRHLHIPALAHHLQIVCDLCRRQLSSDARNICNRDGLLLDSSEKLLYTWR